MRLCFLIKPKFTSKRAMAATAWLPFAAKNMCHAAVQPAEPGAAAGMLDRIEQIVAARKAAPPAGSYVASLLAKGEAAVCRKIGEEAVEVVTAALGGEGDRRVVEEVADLFLELAVELGDADVGRQVGHLPAGEQRRTFRHAGLEQPEQGVDAEVIDLRSLTPLDREAVLTSVSTTSRALLLHEATLTGGIGGELAAITAEEAFEYLDAPVMRVASLDSPVPYSPPLEAAFLPNVEKVVSAAKRLINY